MNLLDYIMIGIILYCLIRGIFRGVVRELTSIVGVFAGYYFASVYHPFLSAILSKWLPHAAYLNVLCYFIIFVSVLIAVSLFGVVVKYLLNICDLGWSDRIFGSLFGVARGVLITAVVLIVLTAFLPKQSPIVDKSFLSPLIAELSENMTSLLNARLNTGFHMNLGGFKENWNTR